VVLLCAARGSACSRVAAALTAPHRAQNNQVARQRSNALGGRIVTFMDSVVANKALVVRVVVALAAVGAA
jgi:hypothetical protein